MHLAINAHMLPDLLGQIPADESIGSVSGDGAYGTKACHTAIAWRSLVETKMHCFKRLGERVLARAFERQVAELHVRVALLNRFTQIERPATVPAAAMGSHVRGWGYLVPYQICATQPPCGKTFAASCHRPENPTDAALVRCA